MKAFHMFWLALLAGRSLCTPEEKDEHLHQLSTINDGGQVVLNAPSLEDSHPAVEKLTGGTKTTLDLRQFDHSFWWPSQWKMVTFVVRHNGPGKVDKVVMEGPDLRALNLSILSLWPAGSCPGTDRGSSRIRCEWKNISPGFHRFSDVKITLDDYDSAHQPPAIELPFTVTAYVNNRVVESTEGRVRWERMAALRYKQTELSRFKQPRTITVAPWPDAETERRRLRQAMRFADFQSTGFYLNPGSPLKVYVGGVQPGGPKPRLLVGTPALVHPTIDSEMTPNSLEELPMMDNGNHTVSSKLGGILYIQYTYKESDANNAYPVRVTLADGDSAQPFPFFCEGTTTDDEWQEMLNHTKVPFVEHSGRRVRITGLAKDAKVFADRGQKQDRLFDLYREILEAQDYISALDAHSGSTTHRASPLGNMIVQTTKRTNPNAYHYRAAIPRERGDEIWSEDRLRQSWMLWHEFGHQRQQTAVWSWRPLTEITVNIYSLAALRHFKPDANRPEREWEQAKKWLARPASQKNFDKLTSNEFYIGLVMFEQLRVAFGGDSFYRRLHAAARKAPELDSNADKKHFFMTRAAQYAETDLTDYFTRWGLAPEQRTIKEMQRLPKPKEDYTKTPVYGGK